MPTFTMGFGEGDRLTMSVTAPGRVDELEVLLAMPNLPAEISKQARDDLAKVNARLADKK